MPDDLTLSQRLMKLEELFAHQEHHVQQLNEVILGLRAEQEALASRLQKQLAQLEARVESREQTDDPDEKPPHY